MLFGDRAEAALGRMDDIISHSMVSRCGNALGFTFGGQRTTRNMVVWDFSLLCMGVMRGQYWVLVITDARFGCDLTAGAGGRSQLRNQPQRGQALAVPNPISFPTVTQHSHCGKQTDN